MKNVLIFLKNFVKCWKKFSRSIFNRIGETGRTKQKRENDCKFFLKFINYNLIQFSSLKSVIFIRDKNSKNQEISGYIDYAHRLKTEDFEAYFSSRKKLLPKPTDLSFYNWENQAISSNNTPNYQVIAESVRGILFKNKRDRKILNVDPNVSILRVNS